MSLKTLYLTILKPNEEDTRIENINKSLLNTKSISEITKYAGDLKIAYPTHLSIFRKDLMDAISAGGFTVNKNNSKDLVVMDETYITRFIKGGNMSVIVLYTKNGKENQYECVFTYGIKKRKSLNIQAFTVNNSIAQKERSISGKEVFNWFYRKIRNYNNWVNDIYITAVSASENFWASVKFHTYEINTKRGLASAILGEDPNKGLIPMKRHIDDWTSVSSQSNYESIKESSRNSKSMKSKMGGKMHKKTIKKYKIKR